MEGLKTIQNDGTSHTRNLVELDIVAKYEIYKHGPDRLLGVTPTITNPTLQEVFHCTTLAAKTKIAIIGFSRGAMTALWLANSLSNVGIPVDIAILMDPVDMSWPILLLQLRSKVASKCWSFLDLRSAVLMLTITNFRRMSINGRIELSQFNHTTEIKRYITTPHRIARWRAWF